MNSLKKWLAVAKPLRYVDHEINRSNKNIEDLLSICLIYPDIYEIGMSNYGVQLIYNEINKSNLLFADRFYMPGLDAIEKFGQEIFQSLEQKKQLNTFDIIGFSLQCELTYTNMLFILDKSGIGIKAEKRVDFPIVVAGGSCVYNPQPLKDFIDVFFIGEMELKFVEVCETLYKYNLKSRKDVLRYFNEYSFCYVPAIEETKNVKRFINIKFSNSRNDDDNLIPLFEIIHDRLIVEAVRGCTNGCRFCQAGYIYRPLREKGIDTLIDETRTKLRKTGYLNCTFLSLSLSDYSELDSLIKFIRNISERTNTAISVPSIRADLINSQLLDNISFIKRSGFTIAAEAGSESLRRAINKNITNDDLFFLVEEAAKKGWDSVKIYFMIGLPYETEEDIESIVKLTSELKKRGRTVNKNFTLTVSISNFVPKAFTPFQWVKQASREYLLEKQEYLRKTLRQVYINAKFHNVDQSIIEGILSRGDKKVANIIESAYRFGCVFDEWKECFDFSKWINAFNENNVNYTVYLNRNFDFHDELPWGFIDIGVTKDFLYDEYKKSSKLLKTSNCAKVNCNGCGVCDFKEIKNTLSTKTGSIISNVPYKEGTNEKILYKIHFEKKEVAIFLSALDVNRLFSIVLRSVGVKFAFSKGFHRLPKINYVYPLPLGIEGENEILIIEVEKSLNKEEVKILFNKKVSCGLQIKDIVHINFFKQESAIAEYSLDDDLFNCFKKLIDSNNSYYKKSNKKGLLKVVNINDYLVDYGHNKVTVKIDSTGSVNFIDFFKYWNYYNINSSIRRELIKINQMG